ncbi:3-oxoacyl-ACP reductase FabG [Brevibacillus ruminantium]|uniref:3-oxoacyl-ACP reductase FabG n=1 Tax=Brevibacillus ruminantium TaxID=2950604 RepID=A0ABY4WD21_9BACL|nr:3-oxoacyl-ACP reductase family protein [Brevibacillus ruminantium]USG65067.1 3-oxoacyl-ACP reductase FabG [Brevibacillus ruminantium]
MHLLGKVALVTGGASGIGVGICKKLAEKGAKVVVNYIGDSYEEKAKNLVQEIRANGGDAIWISGDVTNQTHVEQMINSTLEQYGKIDILVNNAGITIDGLTQNLETEDFIKVLSVNLVGPFLTMKLALPHMIANKFGRIINISSVAALIGLRGAPAYAASKAGLIGLSKTTAREVARKGITVNVICPGYINAGMTERVAQEYLDSMTPLIPMGIFGEPEDIGGGVVFLASDEAKLITGEVIRIDGGIAM